MLNHLIDNLLVPVIVSRLHNYYCYSYFHPFQYHYYYHYYLFVLVFLILISLLIVSLILMLLAELFFITIAIMQYHDVTMRIILIFNSPFRPLFQSSCAFSIMFYLFAAHFCIYNP